MYSMFKGSNMKILPILFLTLICVSCGLKKEKKITKYNVNPELQPYVTTFQSKLSRAGQNSKINDLEAHFSDSLGTSSSGTVIGTCQTQKRTKDTGLVVEVIETPIIKINRAWWKYASDASREELMYHELGHCIIKRGHDSVITDGFARSIMYPLHLGEDIYTSRYSLYMAELFNTPLVAFEGLTFNDNYASVYVVNNSEEYKEEVSDDSHIKDCYHELEPFHIVVQEDGQEVESTKNYEVN